MKQAIRQTLYLNAYVPSVFTKRFIKFNNVFEKIQINYSNSSHIQLNTKPTKYKSTQLTTIIRERTNNVKNERYSSFSNNVLTHILTAFKSFHIRPLSNEIVSDTLIETLHSVVYINPYTDYHPSSIIHITRQQLNEMTYHLSHQLSYHMSLGIKAVAYIPNIYNRTIFDKTWVLTDSGHVMSSAFNITDIIKIFAESYHTYARPIVNVIKGQSSDAIEIEQNDDEFVIRIKRGREQKKVIVRKNFYVKIHRL